MAKINVKRKCKWAKKKVGPKSWVKIKLGPKLKFGEKVGWDKTKVPKQKLDRYIYFLKNLKSPGPKWENWPIFPI